MSKQIFALLVGINQYPEGVSDLQGCVQDVQNMHDFLTTVYKMPTSHIVVLTDQEANRTNFIQTFRTHFGQAKEGDTIFFHYSGHGSREKSPKEFWEFFPEKKNETLVLSDSRVPGGLDFADKELALLIHELAPSKADIVLNIDACHSGSITRSENDLLSLRKRQSENDGAERGIGDYLEGQYQRMLAEKNEIYIPRTKHLVMSACSQFQSAYETKDNKGAFTTALLEALEDPTLHYVDVFAKANIKIKQWAYRQNPVIYPAEGFNTFQSFLTHQENANAFYPNIYFDTDQWTMEMGAIQGIPTDAKEPSIIEIFEKDAQSCLGTATIREVLTDKSLLEAEEEAMLNKEKTYKAKITHLPTTKMQVSLYGEQLDIDLLKNQFAQENSLLLNLQENLSDTLYKLECTKKHYAIYETATNRLVYGVTNNAKADKKTNKKPSINRIIESLEYIARWHRLATLQNRTPKILPGQVSFLFEQKLPDNTWQTHPLQSTFYLNKRQNVEYQLAIQNDRHQTLYASLVQLTDKYQIKLVDQQTLAPKAKTVIREKSKWIFSIMDKGVEKTMTYLLIISTEHLNHPIVPFERGINVGKIETLRSAEVRGLASRAKHRRYPSIRNDWFTHLMQMKIVKQQEEMPATGQSTQVKNAAFTLYGHSTLRGQLALESTQQLGRNELTQSFKTALQKSGWEMVSLAQNELETLEVLTLYNLTKAESVTSDNPLKVQLNIQLTSDETLMALAFYGQEVHVLGEAINVDEILLTKLITHPNDTSVCQICFAKGKKDNLTLKF